MATNRREFLTGLALAGAATASASCRAGDARVNAGQFQPDANVPPNWDELGDMFISKARKHKPRKADRAYANVLRLAEEVVPL